MAWSDLINAYTQWFLANRPGSAPSGTPGSCLVSDLAAGDYLPGSRTTIVSTGSTTSGVRTLTVERGGVTTNVGWVAASSVIAIRP